MLAQVFPISEKMPRDRNLVGGKAAGLGDLCRAGAPVPDGVVVVLPSSSPTPTGDVMELIYRLLRSEPDDTSLFAVRSSTVLEDGTESSFAGMFQTFLNVKRSEIRAAVHECANAVNSDRVRSYLDQRKIASGVPTVVPVIVQRMVSSTVAGVAFTANPLSGDPNRYTIEAAPGLGEAVVSGAVTPDLYVVDIQSRTLVEFEPGDWPGAPHLRALTDTQLAMLVDLMRVMRSLVGYDLDIEFAFHNNMLFALQMRPITALAS